MSLDLPDWRVVYVIRKALPITGLDSPEPNVSCFIPRTIPITLFPNPLLIIDNCVMKTLVIFHVVISACL